MKGLGIGVVASFAMILLVMGCFVVGNSCRAVDEVASVAHEEFGARASLAKYEWFKDAAAQLDKKRADIRVYQAGLDGSAAEWAGKEMPRDVREERSLRRAEVMGAIASYNALAAEYNAAHAKFNWRFADRGNVPAGSVLPREFKPYDEGGGVQ